MDAQLVLAICNKNKKNGKFVFHFFVITKNMRTEGIGNWNAMENTSKKNPYWKIDREKYSDHNKRDADEWYRPTARADVSRRYQS